MTTTTRAQAGKLKTAAAARRETPVAGATGTKAARAAMAAAAGKADAGRRVAAAGKAATPATAAAAAASLAPAAPLGCTNLKLRQAARLVTRHYEAHLAASGLKITQYSLLSHIVALGPVGAGDLAAAMQLSASTLSRNLQPLVAAGWARVAAGGDARSRVVQATTAGRARRAAAQRAWKRSQLALNDRLGSERVAALHVLLDGCIAAFGALEQENTDD